MKHCSLTTAPLYFTLPLFRSSVSCWWTAWPCTATAAPSASRWRRSWSNSPETSTVPFRWEKNVWKSAAHSHRVGSSSEPFPPPVWKGRVEGGKEKKKCKIPNLSGRRHFCPFWTWMQRLGCVAAQVGGCVRWRLEVWWIFLFWPLSVCRARSQPAARRTAARARRPTLQRHPSCYRWGARVALSSQCSSQAPQSRMCRHSCSTRPETP